jgi:hypothetical protein
MSGSIDLVRAWVLETLRSLADDDDHSAGLRDTLWVFLQEGGSFKATAERLTVTRTPSSTGSARPRRVSAVPSTRTTCRSSWPCWPATGWGRQSSGRRPGRAPAVYDGCF